VVSAYNELGGNPCWEIRLTLGLAQKVAVQRVLGALLPVPIDSAGNRAEGAFDHRDHCNLAFREVDAIGHPLTSLSELAGDFGLVCESQTMPFVPYFQSGLDALAWRQEVPEILYPASSIPGLRENRSGPGGAPCVVTTGGSTPHAANRMGVANPYVLDHTEQNFF
jgi:integrating conjugative element protein (TIGR03756 family)